MKKAVFIVLTFVVCLLLSSCSLVLTKAEQKATIAYIKFADKDFKIDVKHISMYSSGTIFITAIDGTTYYVSPVNVLIVTDP